MKQTFSKDFTLFTFALSDLVGVETLVLGDMIELIIIDDSGTPVKEIFRWVHTVDAISVVESGASLPIIVSNIETLKTGQGLQARFSTLQADNMTVFTIPVDIVADTVELIYTCELRHNGAVILTGAPTPVPIDAGRPYVAGEAAGSSTQDIITGAVLGAAVVKLLE